MIEKQEIYLLTPIWLVINLIIVIQVITKLIHSHNLDQLVVISSWINTYFEPKDYPIAYISWKIGKALGSLVGKKIFLPLSSIEWLNSRLFWLTHFDSPILTHFRISMFVSFAALSIFFYVLFFIEEKDENSTQNYGFVEIITQQIPKIIYNRYNTYLFIYLFFTMVPDVMIWQSSQLIFIKNGINISDLAEITLICWIPRLIFLSIFSRYLKTKRILQQYHLIMMYHGLVALVMYLSLVYLMETKDYGMAYYLLLATLMLDLEHPLVTGLTMTFYTKVADPKFRSTSINIRSAFQNLIRKGFRTIGFKFGGMISYPIFGGTLMVAYFISMIAFFKIADYLNNLEPDL